MTFEQALRQTYLANPCQVLPNALWKTLAGLAGCETDYKILPDGSISHLEIWQRSRLLLYWDLDRTHLSLSPSRAQTIDFALLHADYLPQFERQALPQQTAYFRLLFRGMAASPALPSGYTFLTADPIIPDFPKTVAEFIGQCYEQIHPSPQAVEQWLSHPVYVSDLWVWIWDACQNRPAGLGIAEIDGAIGEGSLEWIQLLPEYRGKGLGKGLVLELLQRMRGRCSFVTVSGEVDNQTGPERLYRSCGFQGNDAWWLLRKGG